MKLLDTTSEDLCMAALQVPDKETCLRTMCAQMVRAGRVADDRKLLRALLEREAVESTGIGRGIALPHARCEDFRGNAVAIASLAHSVDFGSPDGRPVDLVFLLAGSQRSPGQQLRTLALLSRLVRVESFLEALRKAASPAEMIEVLRATESG